MLDFILEFILAMFFILFFKVQKLFFPNIYFTFSDSFIRRESIRFSKYLFRFFVIFFFNMFFYLILNIFYEGQEIFKLLLIASFLGSFLILWPIIFRPSRNLEEGMSKKSTFFLYCIYTSFLFSTLIISSLTTSIMNLFLKEMDILTVFSSNKEGILFEILMLPIFTVFETMFINKYQSVRTEDDSKVNFNNINDTYYEDFEGEAYVYKGYDYEDYKIHQKKFKYTVLCITFINLGLLVFDIIKKMKRKD